ncbi:MAG: precorrin-8X methylmutase [Candidatus Methanogranum gryphiswaldense]|nr:MAG: precorrin-8X methylmutase [Candidatus Methanogranum sp. U3.2.1]
MTFDIIKPEDIEKRSMEIITKELEERTLPEPQLSVLKRCIHTSADFDYYDNLVFSKNAVQIGIKALRTGADIVTDTKMAAAGINKTKLKQYGGEVHCFISDDDVVNDAKERGCTRATVCMEKGAKLKKPVIFAVGNAPTALLELERLIREEGLKPTLIIGVPVGFVNVIESKDLIMKTNTPHIIARGRKGGSNIAATICNAMLYYKDEV